MSVKITGDNDRIVNKIQSRLDKFSKCTKAYDKARKALDDFAEQEVELANIPAREDRYNIVLSEYKEAAKKLKDSAVKIEEKTDDKHLHKYCRLRENQFRTFALKEAFYRYIHVDYKEYLKGIHAEAEKIIEIDFDTQVTQAQNESQRRKAEVYSVIEFSTINQTFPSCRDRLIQENPNEYLRQAALYQHKILEQKEEKEALAFGNAWIKSLPKEATWEQVENMSFMMLEAANTNEKVDLSEYRSAVEQWSREHPLSENPDPTHLTPDQATTPWGRRTYLLGLLANQNSDISPEAFQLYQNCGFLYPDQHRWKVVQAYYHISKLQCIEAEQLLDDLPKEDPSVIQVQKDLNVAKAAREFSLIDQTFPNSRDELLQENPDEYLRQAALYQYKLLKTNDRTEVLAFGNLWIKNLPKEATWEQVEDMSFIMIEAAATNNNSADLSEYRAAVQHWLQEHPLTDNLDSVDVTPAQATTPWGRRTYIVGLLYYHNQKLDLCPEAFQAYQSCSALYPDQHFWKEAQIRYKIAQAHEHISNLEWVEAEQSLVDLPTEDALVRNTQIELNYGLNDRIASFGIDVGLIVLPRIIPSSYRETATFDIAYTGLHLLTNGTTRRMWVPRVLGIPERAIPFNPFKLPFSAKLSMLGDVVDCLFRRCADWMLIQNTSYAKYSFVSYTLRTVNIVYALTDPSQRSLPSLVNLGSQLISLDQSYAECQEIRRSATYHFVSSSVQIVVSDLGTAYTIASYSDLIPVAIARLPQFASSIDTTNLETRVSTDSSSTSDGSSRTTWLLAAAIGSWAAYRFYYDYAYLWAVSVMSDMDFYFSQGKHEEVQRVLDEAENSYFVSRAKPTVRSYAHYVDYLKDYHRLLNDPVKYQDFLMQLDLLLNILNVSSHYRSIRNNVLLKKLETAIIQKDTVRLEEVFEEGPNKKFGMVGVHFFLSHTFNFALNDLTEASSFLEEMKPSFPSDFHPTIESFLELLQTQSDSLKEWPKLEILSGQQNPISSKQATQWVGELQQLQDFFSKNFEKPRMCQDLQYYKLIIAFAKTEGTQQIEALFKESIPEIHQRFSHALVQCTRHLRKTGKHQEAIKLLKRAEIQAFADNQLIQNYGRFFSLIYSLNLHKDSTLDQMKDLESCIAGLDTQNPVHQQLHVYFSACRIVLSLDMGDYVNAQELLAQAKTDLKVLDETAALLFERVFISVQGKRDEKARSDLKCIIKNLGSGKHLELFKAYHDYLESESTLEVRFECLTSVLTQIESIEQLSEIEPDLRHQRHLLEFELRLSQCDFETAKGFLVGPLRRKLYAQLCNILSGFFVQQGEQLRQKKLELSITRENLLGLNTFFEIPKSKVLQSYINFLVYLDKSEGKKDIAAYFEALQVLKMVFEELESINSLIPKLLITEQIKILIKIATLAKNTGQRKIGLDVLETIERVIIEKKVMLNEELKQIISILKEQLNA